MLEACGFAYDATLDAYVNEREARVLPVDLILGRTELWVAQWITETLSAFETETAARATASTRRTT
jgi:hypothetical protein